MARLPRPQQAQRIGFSWRERLLVALVAALLAGLLWGGGGVFLSRVTLDFEKDWQDRLRNRLDPTPMRQDFVFLGVDNIDGNLSALEPEEIEGSVALEAMSQPYPWSRRVWAEAIQRLGDSGAKLILLDVYFPGPSGDPEADEALAQVLQKYGERVVLASQWTPSGNDRLVFQKPYEEFCKEGRAAFGYVNFWPDVDDEVFRSAQYSGTPNQLAGGDRIQDEVEQYSFVAVAAQKLGIDVIPEDRFLRFAGKQKEDPETGEIIAESNYMAGRSYSPKSLYTLFATREWEVNYENGRFFDGKIVIIGPANPIFNDQLLTPHGIIFGPQMHLQALACLLEDQFLDDPPAWMDWFALFLMCAIAALLVMRIRSPLVVFGMVVVLAVAWIFGCSYMANATGVLFTGFSGLIGLVFVSVGCEGTEFFFEQKARKKLHRQLRRSVSRDVAEAMVRAPEGYLDAARGGRRTVAILFSDVRNFTARSERMEPEALVEQLNAYFAAMVEAVFATGGTIDKFIGDAVMASWGGLIDRSEEEMATLALEAAKGMQEGLARLNSEWEAKGWEGFEVGIGIHIGDAVVGEIGSEERSDFTAIGDAVNVASRVEGMTKQLGVSLLVSGRVAKSAEAGLVLLGAFRVKGREEGLEIFTSASEGAESWKAGLAALRSGDVAQAREAWARLKKSEDALSGPVQFYEHWLAEQEGALPANWDGVVRLGVK